MASTSVAILAKAPIPGFAKTRLIPSIGAHAAAVLQERLTAHTVATAAAAHLRSVTVWCTPDLTHRSFRELGVALKRQPGGGRGARRRAAGGGAPARGVGAGGPARTPARRRAAAGARGARDGGRSPAE